MGIHDGHRARKRQQVLNHGLDSLEDHEVLEVLLYYAIPRRDTNETAHLLLDKFGSLQGVLDASMDELQQVEGVGENAACLFYIISQLPRRAQLPKKTPRIINSIDAAGSYFVRLLSKEKQEMLYIMCLDAKGKVIACRQISRGSANMTEVNMGQVALVALQCGAHAIILAHNHPSGVALPSAADQQVTRSMCESLRIMGVRLLDHIIVADGDYVSMAQSDIIRP